jgi:hypothetical protein
VPGSPVPQDSDRFVVPVREQILDRFPESFTRFQRKRSFDRTKLRLSLVVLVVILLLFSYLLGRAAVVGGGGGGGGGRTNGGNAATIRPTASVQTLATISAQQTAVAQATEQALTTYTTSGDRDVVFGYVFIRGNSVLPASSTPTLPNGSSFTVSILFLNTGSSVWTASEYTLVCVPGNDPDCQNARFKGIMNNQSVRPGQMYAFSVMLTAKDPPGPHHITLSVAHNGKPVGASQAIHFSVSDS